MSEQPSGHEPISVSIRFLVATAIALVLLVVGVLALMVPLYRYGFGTSEDVASDRPDHEIGRPGLTEPRLQQSPQQDYDKYFAEQQRRLNGYGWAVGDGRVAHIPIGRAIDLTLQRGLPVRKPPKKDKRKGDS